MATITAADVFAPLAILWAALPVTLPLLGLLTLVAFALIGWGRPWLGGVGAGGAAERSSIALALGMTGMGMALFGLGLAGAIGPWAVAGLLVAGFALFLAGSEPRSMSRGVLWLAPLVFLTGTLLAYPLTGWDPAMYRLPAARAFADSGGLAFVPELRFPIGPQLGEALFAGALALADDRMARGIVFLAFLGTAALTFGWARRRLGAGAGLVAGAIVVGSPGAVLYGTDAYVDVLQALLTLAALAVAEPAGEEGDGRLSFAAGALAGASAAVRYTGLLAVALVPFAILAAAPVVRRKRAFLMAVAGAAAIATPWYLRTAIVTGNPLFPLATSLFGANDWALGSLAALYGSEGLGSFFLRLTMRPDEGPPVLNPWLPVLLPLAAAAAWRERWLRVPVGFGLALTAALWAIAPDPRFLLPALGPLALGAAAGLSRLAPGLLSRRSLALGLAVALAAPGLLYSGFRLARLGAVPRGPEAVARFLTREVPGWSLVAALEDVPGPRRTVYAYYGERLRFYSRHRWLGDTSGPYRWGRVKPVLADPAALARVLRGFGADFFVWVRAGQPEPAWLATGAPGLERIHADPAGGIYRVTPDHAAAMAPATSSRISGVE